MSQYLVEVKVWGQYACFTRPEFKVERVSYPLISPSAAKGILEAIYWKPQFRWHVTEIAVLAHPEHPGTTSSYNNFMPITLNEITDKRVQRTCLVLRWPCYRVRAKAEIFCNTTNRMSIKEQFERRVARGQCFHQPYFGLRQFTACFGEVSSEDVPQPVSERVGRIVLSAEMPPNARSVQYRFVDCTLINGCFDVERAIESL